MAIVLLFTQRTGREHPHLQTAFRNYRHLLAKMGRNEDEHAAAIEALKASVEQ